jgi:hypothetical protein
MGPGRTVAIGVLVLAAGCRGLFGLDDPLPGDLGDAAIDTAPIDAIPTCGVQGLTCSGNAVAYQCADTCWVGCSESLPHNTASTRCTQWGGRLAPFESSSDQQCFRDYIQPSDDAWTGLEQMTGAASPAAGWSWNGDGLATPFLNWGSGQPDDGDANEDGAQQCAQILDGTNKWQDVPCSATFTFACSEHIDD